MKLIETKTLTTAQSNITFSAVPQNFTDVVILLSGRCTLSAANYSWLLNFNADSGSNYIQRRLYGSGTGTATDGAANTTIPATINGGGETANTFSNYQIYLPNYSGATTKTVSIDGVTENNATAAFQFISAHSWNNTTGISTIDFTLNGAGNTWVAGSTVSLYGIGGAGDGWAPKATGGVISRSGDYYVHTFTASGTFTPTAALSDVEYLVIGGGGGGGTTGSNYANGGGGAGGYRSSVTGESSGGGATAETKLSLTSGTNYTVTVGAGGTGAASGVASSISSLVVSSGGGRGGSGFLGAAPENGGSGGGSGSDGGSSSTPGTGATGQGFAGSLGSGTTGHTSAGGGGGGAGQAGVRGTINPNALTTVAGKGGNGLSSSITGTAVTRGGGGGGGQDNANNFGAGGTGGGGAGGGSSTAATNGTSNTGGGGGGRNVGNASANGGSGIVIVRYLA
jgi:hypothetical protein